MERAGSCRSPPRRGGCCYSWPLAKEGESSSPCVGRPKGNEAGQSRSCALHCTTRPATGRALEEQKELCRRRNSSSTGRSLALLPACLPALLLWSPLPCALVAGGAPLLPARPGHAARSLVTGSRQLPMTLRGLRRRQEGGGGCPVGCGRRPRRRPPEMIPYFSDNAVISQNAINQL